MCPFLSNHYYTTLVHSITERAHDYGYLTFVAPTLRNPSTEQYYLDLMKNDLDTAGIVYLYPTSFLPEVNDMSKQIPIVNIGDKNDEITFDSIHVSSSKPARLVAEHLISLGHRKITYISTPISDIERSRSNVTMHLLQPSKNTALEMTASVFVPSHPESIICCLQICWNILPDTI